MAQPQWQHATHVNGFTDHGNNASKAEMATVSTTLQCATPSNNR